MTRLGTAGSGTAGLGLPEPPATERDRLAARWLHLTRAVLPGMAAAQDWPIQFDHCFMRVCLDNALGRPWQGVVRRPALRHMDACQLRAAVAVAEQVLADPAALPALNKNSLAWRRAARR